MPKYQPELGTKLIIPEEEIMTEECDTDIPDVWDLENPDHVKVQGLYTCLYFINMFINPEI